MNALLSNARHTRLSRWLGSAALASALVLAACGPSDLGAAKLKPLKTGTPRATVLSTMGTGPLAPTSPMEQPRIVNGFRRQMYITNGGNGYEVLWYREEPGTVEDPILKERETPLVLVGDTLVGWGWKFYTPYAKKEKLPDPSHDAARLDSIYKSQNPDTTKK
jgi:hypothetical protein